MNLFVAKLNFSTQEADLREAFEQFGEVSSCSVITDKFSGRSKGFAFVEMPNDDEAQAAINALDETELDGRTIVVKKAEPRENRPPRDNRGGGGGYGGGGNRGGGGGYGGGGNRGGGGGYGGGGNRGGGGGYGGGGGKRY
jgi:cold-inducible RNA-binding protein